MQINKKIIIGKFHLKFLILLFCFIFSLFLTNDAHAANRYWVGSEGGSVHDSANWSAAQNSCGVSGGASVPNSADVIYFTTSCTNTANMNQDWTVGGTIMSEGTLNANSFNFSNTGTFTQSGGTFNGGSGTVTISGGFTLSGTGIFNASTGTTNLNSAVTNTSGGTFNHNNGSVSLGGGAVSIDVNSTITFNNLTISTPTTSNARTIGTGDTLIVLGNFILNQGILNTGSVSARGNITINSNSSGGTATITSLNDGTTTARTITFNGGSVPNFVINNAYASVVYNTSTTFASLNIQSLSGNFDVGAIGITVSGTFTQSGGTFNGGSTTINLGQFTLSGTGVFNASTATTNFNSAFANTSGGTFNHNNGTAVLAGGAVTIDVNSTITFNNLTISTPLPVNARTIAGGDTLIVLNDFLLNQGTVNTGSISVRGNATFTANSGGGTGTISIINDGTANSKTVTFNGGTVPNITLNNAYASVVYNASTSFSSLNIQNISGTFNIGNFNLTTVSGGFTQSGGTFTSGNGTISVGSTFSLSAGTFNGGSGTLTVPSTFTLSGTGVFNASSGTTNLNNAVTNTSGGTFNHNNGTIVLGGGSVTIDVNSSWTLNNLTINTTNSGNTKTIATGDTLITLGTFTQTQGIINTGSISARGNIVIGAGANGGSATITSLNDGTTTARTITFNGGSAPNFVINNAYASVAYNSSTTFTSLNLQSFSGTFDVGSNNLTSTNGITQSGGTFNGGSGTITLSSSFTLSGTGVFTASSGNTFIATSFTNTSGGTFNHNNGTVILNGGSGTIDINSSFTFHNLTINTTNSGNSKTLGTNDTLVVNGNFNLTQGRILTGTIDVKGDLSFDSGVNATPGTTAIILSGTGEQNITSSIATSPVNTMTISNTGGTAKLVSNFTISTITISSGGTFDVNNYNLSATTLTVNGGGTLALRGSETITPASPTFNSGAIVKHNAPSGTNAIKNWTYTNVVLTIDSASPETIYTLPGNITVLSLNINSGKLQQGAQDITTGSTGSITVGAGGYWENLSANTITIGSGGVTNNGTIVFDGNGVGLGGADAILIRSTSAGQQRTWSGTGTFGEIVDDTSMVDVDVMDQDGNIEINVYSSTDSGNNDVAYWIFLAAPVTSSNLTVRSFGSQTQNITVDPENPELIEIGGGFSFVQEVGESTIQSITLEHTGTLGYNYFSEIELRYKNVGLGTLPENTCPTTAPIDTSLFGDITNITSEIFEITGNLVVAGNERYCFYPYYEIDLGGDNELFIAGKSIKFQITETTSIELDPLDTADITLQKTPLTIWGSTVITQNGVSSLTLLNGNDEIVFYVEGGVLYKDTNGNSVRLTSADVIVDGVNFTNLTNPDGTSQVQIELALRYAGQRYTGAQSITQYYKTTVNLPRR